MKNETVFLASLFLVSILAHVATCNIQVGARFPQGLLLGDDASCDDVNEGRVRYSDGSMQLCNQNHSWSIVSSGDLSLDEVVSLLEDILGLLQNRENITALLQRVLDEQSNLGTAQGQANAVNCLGHGVFTTGLNSFDEDYCDCYLDNDRGHYKGARCGHCVEGWARDLVGDCVVDIEDPSLTVYDEYSIFAFLGEPLVHPRYEALDNHDGNITHLVEIIGTVDVNVIGDYPVTYSITDEAGHVVTKDHMFHVVADNLLRAGRPSYSTLSPADFDEDSCRDSECSSSNVMFHKYRDDSRLRVVWSSNYACASSDVSVGCSWEIRVNGTSCDPPIRVDLHTHTRYPSINDGDVSNDNRWPFTAIGYCEQLSGGAPLSGGSTYRLSVHEIGSPTSRHGSPVLGYPSSEDTGHAYLLEASEIAQPSLYTYRVAVLGNDNVNMYSDSEGEMVTRRMDFNQPTTGGMLRFSASDNFRCRSRGTSGPAACRFAFYVDGEECTSPGPMNFDMYRNIYHNSHYQQTLVSFCNETSSGPIAAGTHQLSVQIRQVPGYSGDARGDTYLGWNVVTSVYEVVPVRSTLSGYTHASLTGGREDTTAEGELPTISVPFEKSTYGSALRISWTDTVGCASRAASTVGACAFRVLIDGHECAQPGGFEADVYTGVGSGSVDVQFSMSVVGYCDVLSNGQRILPGSHVLTIEEGPIPGNMLDHGWPKVGFGATMGSIEIEEVPVEDYEALTDTPVDLRLFGEQETFHILGDTYEDPGASAWDIQDGDVSSSIVSSGSVDVNTIGVNSISYNVTDSDGHVAAAVRTVHVVGDSILGGRTTYATLDPSETNVDNCANSECTSRGLTFRKLEDSSRIRLVWADNFRCGSSDVSVACRWEVRFNGTRCYPSILVDYHTHGRNGPIGSGSDMSVNTYWPTTVIGYCDTLENGDKMRGGEDYVVTVHQVGTSTSRFGSPTLGFPSNSNTGHAYMMEATEVPASTAMSVRDGIISYESVNLLTDPDTEFVGRRMSFEQPETGGMLRFTIADSLRCRGRGTTAHAACRLTFLVDGEECVSPAPVHFDDYASEYLNHIHFKTMVWFCNATTSGPIAAGTHTLSLWATGVPGYTGQARGDPLIGWNLINSVYEVIPVRTGVAGYGYGVMPGGRDETTTDDVLSSVSLPFQKTDYASVLRVSWTDSFTCTSSGSSQGTCAFRVLIDGMECAQPGGLEADLSTQVGNGGLQATTVTTVSGYCHALANGFRVFPGEHMLTIQETAVDGMPHGSPRIGWGATPGSVEVQEVPLGVFSVADTDAPWLVLEGDEEMILFVDDEFVEGFQAWDDVDGNITDSVIRTGSVDTSVPGTYTLSYNVSDAAGNTDFATRVIHVMRNTILGALTPARATLPPAASSIDSCSNSQCTTRQLYVRKMMDESVLRIQYMDNFRCASTSSSSSVGCRWEIRVNGSSCNPPLQIYWHTHARYPSINHGDVGSDNRWPTSLVGYCPSLSGSSEPLSSGIYHLTVHQTGSPFSRQGTSQLGFPAGADTGHAYLLEALEVPDTSAFSLRSAVLSGEGLNLNQDADGELTTRRMTFDQPTTGGMLRLVVSDNLRCRSRSSSGVGACRFAFRIDGEDCVSPAGAMVYDARVTTYHNTHHHATVTAFCNETTSGPIAAGSHQLSLHVEGVPGYTGANRGDGYVGWDAILSVYEVAPVPANIPGYTFAMLPGGRDDTTSNAALPTVSIPFSKSEYGSVLRISWSDSFACASSGSSTGACAYRVLIDGKECTQPGGFEADVFNDVSSGGLDATYSSTVSGYCDVLEDGFRVRPGAHFLTIEEGAIPGSTHGSPRIGFSGTLGSIEIEEIPFYRYQTTDSDAPVLVLLGDEIEFVVVGNAFEEPGWQAWDIQDGDLTLSVDRTGTVDVNTVGTYVLTYTVQDSAGNPASDTRTVNVVNP